MPLPRPRILLAALTLMCAGAAAASLLPPRAAPHLAPLPNDIYVWQRAWTPALGQAMDQAAPDIAAWRVLAAEVSAEGRVAPVLLNDARLAALRGHLAGRPVILVVRIDGRLSDTDPAPLLAAALAPLERWREAGVAVAGLEIDHDCPTSRLPFYARFLTDLRARLGGGGPGGTRLSITALPTWLSAPALADVVAVPDEVVLQVHAVAAPTDGLFNPAQAARWVAAYGQRFGTPFRVALPDYGARVSWNADDSLATVEGETPLLGGGAHAAELMARPADVAAFLNDLRAKAPPNLKGIAWFRLPTAEDHRAWSLATWAAVARGQTPIGHIVAQAEATATPGLSSLVLVNDGTADAELPASLDLPAGCPLGDGANGYARDPLATQATPRLVRLSPGLLPPGERRAAGWLRCPESPSPPVIHVRP
ncbi:DUF3142 domain-containing protein [Nitrospirillum viridazoti]|uniref:Uncharacterized protein DUF3142 n=1 Tax=Nitrospirillum amazonense TaxID=28077 RepID=A0A560HSG4_9PROT|nr:DUF3142 domain-containing protein [Nitrospirillum amazonense]TWB49536.1 uncharacterized protein DUF3142 [Nitrospirillum amazonense]